MLLKHETLKGIARGDVQLAFRRWKRPTVRAGGRLRTRIGELAIEAVDRVTLKGITEREARLAGFDARAQLVEELRGREGTVYRIRLRFAGADSRIALRSKSRLSKSEMQTATDRLARMDARSGDGPWTRAYLELIDRLPETRAADLAESIGMAKAPFKSRVRRLKEMGLTESRKIGYRLSPRGRAVWNRIKRAQA